MPKVPASALLRYRARERERSEQVAFGMVNLGVDFDRTLHWAQALKALADALDAAEIEDWLESRA